MSDCCNNDRAIEVLREKQRGTLLVVLVINALMFLVIAAAAFYGRSTSLLTDSLDNFGDALTYGFSLYAVSKGAGTKARVALLKGALILLAACIVAAQIVYRLSVPTTPIFQVMGLFSLLALAANTVCLLLLWRHRRDDINMSSVWECSRNDIAANLSVFAAAGGVWLTGSPWPDIAVALGLLALLTRSALRVIASSVSEIRATA